MDIISTADNVSFSVRKRKNRDTRKGYEWVLYCRIDDDSSGWVIFCWDNKPKKEEIVKLTDLACQAMEIYHKNLHINRFNLESDVDYKVED